MTPNGSSFSIPFRVRDARATTRGLAILAFCLALALGFLATIERTPGRMTTPSQPAPTQWAGQPEQLAAP